MNSRFTYEAEIKPDEQSGYTAAFPQLPDAFTFGEDIPETIERAGEVLELVVAEYLDEGKSLPVPIYSTSPDGVYRVAVSVVVTADDVERSKCVTTSEAAKMLGLSNGRITHMLDAGALQAVAYGNSRLVTLASINERISTPRKAGRPRKTVVV